MSHTTNFAPGSAIITAGSYATQLRLAGQYQRTTQGHLRRSWLPPKSIHRKMQAFIFERDNYTCQRCGRVDRWFYLDHIKPYKLGGLYIEWNLQALCDPCNARKGATWDGE